MNKMTRVIFAGILIGLVLAAGAAAAPPTTKPSTMPATSPVPQMPGDHRLKYSAKLNGKQVEIAYSVYLPKDYQTKPVPRPMVVFLSGALEVGDNHEGLYVNGPLAEMKRNKDLAQWADFIILTPQCPANYRWENSEITRITLEMVDYALRTWRVDRDRVYLTGLSMGGQGTWRVGAAANGRFAAIAPISAPEVEPQKVAAALGKTAVWVVCGGIDGSYTDGSRRMVKVLTAAKVDTLFTEVPNREHDVWVSYYSNRMFYDILFMHRRGQGPPPGRPDKDKLLAIAYAPPGSMDGKLAGSFKKFLPWWQMLNCGTECEPGLKGNLNGRNNVFVTCPLDQRTPCRLFSTLTVPNEGTPTLRLVVGHHPEGRWRLIFRADGKEILNKVVSKDTAKNGWLELDVPLSAYKGKNIQVELLNQALDGNRPGAYWAQIELIDKKVPIASQPATADSKNRS